MEKTQREKSLHFVPRLTSSSRRVENEKKKKKKKRSEEEEDEQVTGDTVSQLAEQMGQ